MQAGAAFARLTPVVDALRETDAAAERDRVLQYDAVAAIRETGALALRVPVRHVLQALAHGGGIPGVVEMRRRLLHARKVLIQVAELAAFEPQGFQNVGELRVFRQPLERADVEGLLQVGIGVHHQL